MFHSWLTVGLIVSPVPFPPVAEIAPIKERRILGQIRTFGDISPGSPPEPELSPICISWIVLLFYAREESIM